MIFSPEVGPESQVKVRRRRGRAGETCSIGSQQIQQESHEQQMVFIKRTVLPHPALSSVHNIKSNMTHTGFKF